MKKVVKLLVVLCLVSLNIMMASCEGGGDSGTANTGGGGGGNVITPDVIDGGIELDGDTETSLDPLILLRFPQEMNPITINPDTVTLVDEHGNEIPIDQIIASDDNTVFTIILGETLDPNTKYTIKVSDQVKTSKGKQLPSQNLEFTTGNISTPSVSIQSPNNQAVNVNLNPLVQVTFNEEVSNLNKNTVKAHLGSETGPEVPLDQILKMTGNAYSISFTNQLSEEATYYIVFSDQITNLNNYKLKKTVFSFTTGERTSPISMLVSPENNGVNIPTTPTIEFRFNESVTNVNNTTVTLHESSIDGTAVLISQILHTDNNTYTLVLDHKLKDNTVYHIVLSDQIKDLADNSLVATSYLFTTGSYNIPEVGAIEPGDGQTDVSTTPIIDFNFSESVTNVNPGTVELRKDSATGEVIAISDIIHNPDGTYSFTPATPLEDNTTYYVIFTDGIVDADGNPLEERIISFTTGDEHVPTVTMVSPGDNATDVTTAPSIAFRFSEPVSNVNSTNVTLHENSSTGPAVTISQILHTENNTYTLQLSDVLKDDTTYYLVLNNQIKDVANKSLAQTVYSFTTGNYNVPEVGAVEPNNGQTGVTTTPNIDFTFSEPVTNVNKDTVQLRKDSATGESIAITDIVQDPNGTYSFTPSHPLEDNTTYYVVFTDEIVDENGHRLEERIISFTTGDEHVPTVTVLSPADNATGITRLPLISIKFSEKVQHVSTSSVKLYRADYTNPANQVAINTPLLGDNNVYTFTPVESLADNTEYYLVITNSITDLVNKPLSSSVVTSFRVQSDLIAPTVEMVAPSNNATSVSRTPMIGFRFNESVNNVTTSNISLHTGSTTGASVSISQILSVDNNEYQVYLAGGATLAANTTYYLVFSNAIRDIAGNQLSATNYHFTTGSVTAPMVGQMSPANNSTDAVDRPVISFILSGDPQNVSSSTVKLHANTVDGTTLNTRAWATEDLGDGYVRYTFEPPRAGLDDYTTYYIVFSDQITDGNGNPMQTTSVSFTTGNNKAPIVSMVSPLPDQTGVSLMPTIELQFNEHVNNVTESTLSIYIDPNPNLPYLVPENKRAIVNLTYMGNNRYSFSPAASLLSNTNYRVIIWNTDPNNPGFGGPSVGIYDDKGITLELINAPMFTTGQ